MSGSAYYSINKPPPAPPDQGNNEVIPAGQDISAFRLALRRDEFHRRVFWLWKQLELHHRKRRVMAESELLVTLDTAVIFLLRWIPDCWVVAVEFGAKHRMVFSRLLSSAFYLRRMFRYFHPKILMRRVHVPHSLQISYASGKPYREIQYNILTAFYPVAWALRQVWKSMIRDGASSIMTDEDFAECCMLYKRAQQLLPKKVWNRVFAKVKTPTLPSTPTATAALSLSGSVVSRAINLLDSPQVASLVMVEDTATTLKTQQKIFLSSPDAPQLDSVLNGYLGFLDTNFPVRFDGKTIKTPATSNPKDINGS